jgi:acetyl-CoA synthetase
MSADRYAELHRAYRWDVPPQFSIAHACCGRWASERSRVALYWEDENGAVAVYTFRELEQQANRLANALNAMGIARGDKVALILPQRPETVIAHIAVNRIGAVAVPLSFLFGPEALEYRLDDSETKVAFVDPQSLPNMAAVRERCPGIAQIVGVGGAPPSHARRERCDGSRISRVHERDNRSAERRIDATAMPDRQSARVRLLA